MTVIMPGRQARMYEMQSYVPELMEGSDDEDDDATATSAASSAELKMRRGRRGVGTRPSVVAPWYFGL